MKNSVDALRRWLGMFCLAVASGMLIWGHTILASQLKGLGFLIYWMVCFLFTIASIVIALLDVHAMLRNIRKERVELFRRAMKDIKRGVPARGAEEQEEITVARRSLESLEDAR
jgi:uncharacterized membrane protein